MRNVINHLKKYLFLPRPPLFITFWFLVDKFLSLSGVVTATLAPTGRLLMLMMPPNVLLLLSFFEFPWLGIYHTRILINLRQPSTYCIDFDFDYDLFIFSLSTDQPTELGKTWKHKTLLIRNSVWSSVAQFSLFKQSTWTHNTLLPVATEFEMIY